MQGQYNTLAIKVNNLFQQNLPQFPYSTNDFEYGAFRHARQTALKHKYIQFNAINSLGTLVVDIDRETYYEDLTPTPNMAVYNKQNAKCHAIYFLDPSVHLNELSRRKPIIFAENVLKGLTRRLEGDPFYAHMICKNPLNDDFRVYALRDKQYGLDELSEYIPNKILNEKRSINEISRNCQVFDECRYWAYKAIREYKATTFEEFHIAVRNHCIESNSTKYCPMSLQEVKNIAKSISKWVWDKRIELTYNRLQIAAGKQSGQTRKLKADQNKIQALEMLNKGLRIEEIADRLGVTRMTIYNYIGMSI
jgi:hypothetical protein